MNAITTAEPVSAQTLEHVLGTGDLSKLTTQQRVEYYAKTCESLGLNPLTRPMKFLSLNGQIQLYFTRDGTDQLRKAQGITLHVVDKLIEAGLFTVTVRARTKDGREDEDIGAVVLPQSGESRANALMKAMTKAKRRVTLSICGLGQTDESELDTMPGARVFDAEDELPVAPIRDAREQMNQEVPLKAVASDMKRPPRISEPPPGPTPPTNGRPKQRGWKEIVQSTAIALRDAQTIEEVTRVLDSEEVLTARETFKDIAKDEIERVVERAIQKWWPEPQDEPTDDEVHITGEDKVMSG